ncbi:MAG TPA: SURF1 family protein [Microlunatus sp.]|nr:SURF1 family protein [Microlunatus sp.]
MIRLHQALVVLAGLVAAGIMVALGLWQMGVYQASGERSAAERAASPAIPLNEAAPPGAKITDGLGRTVSFTGSYEASLQLGVPLTDASDRVRVLTGLRLPDGRLLAVVRGITTGTPPAPPSGPIEQTGVLLPSENSDDPRTSIRIPLLAQQWPGQLVEGYVNLTSDLSVDQGLDPSPLVLPAAPGRLRNGAYALQWWLFAGFALVLAGRIARDIGRQHDLEVLDGGETWYGPDAAAEHAPPVEAPGMDPIGSGESSVTSRTGAGRPSAT